MQVIILADRAGVWFREEERDGELSKEAREFAANLLRDDPDLLDFLGIGGGTNGKKRE